MDLLIRLFGIPPAYAQDGGAMGGIVQLLPLVAIFGVFYFILIRPQQQKQKQQRLTLDSLVKGDKIVTGGGIIGTIVKAEPGKEEMFVEISPNVRVTIVRSSITAKYDPDAAKSEAAPKPANDSAKAIPKPDDIKPEGEKQG